MKKEKNIGGIIALVAGIVLVVGSLLTLIVIQVNKNRDKKKELDPPILELDPSPPSGNRSTANNFTTEQIKTMQRFLVQLGIQKNNQYIIDAIQLTGGIDGQMGSGFHAAVQEAKDKGYLEGYEDLLGRLGY